MLDRGLIGAIALVAALCLSNAGACFAFDDAQYPDFNGSWNRCSVGKWIDADGSGPCSVLEVEARAFRGPRTYDASGLPPHADEQSIVKQQLYLDNNDKNIMQGAAGFEVFQEEVRPGGSLDLVT